MPLMERMRSIFKWQEPTPIVLVDPNSPEAFLPILVLPDTAADAPRVIDALLRLSVFITPKAASEDPPVESTVFDFTSLAPPISEKLLSQHRQVAEAAVGLIRHALDVDVEFFTQHAPIWIPGLARLAFHTPTATLLPTTPSLNGKRPGKKAKGEAPSEDLIPPPEDLRAAIAHRTLDHIVTLHRLPIAIPTLHASLSLAPIETTSDDEGDEAPKTGPSPSASPYVASLIAQAVEILPTAAVAPYTTEIEEFILTCATHPEPEVRRSAVKAYLIFLRLPGPRIQVFQTSMPLATRRSLSAGLRTALTERRPNRPPSSNSDDGADRVGLASAMSAPETSSSLPRPSISLSIMGIVNGPGTTGTGPDVKVARRNTFMGRSIQRTSDVLGGNRKRGDTAISPSPISPKIEEQSFEGGFAAQAFAGLEKIGVAEEDGEEVHEEMIEGSLAKADGDSLEEGKLAHLAPSAGSLGATKSIQRSKSETGLFSPAISPALVKSSIRSSTLRIRRGFTGLWRSSPPITRLPEEPTSDKNVKIPVVIPVVTTTSVI